MRLCLKKRGKFVQVKIEMGKENEVIMGRGKAAEEEWGGGGGNRGGFF